MGPAPDGAPPRHRDRGVHLDLHQAAAGMVDPRRPARRDRHHQDAHLRGLDRHVLARRVRGEAVGARGPRCRPGPPRAGGSVAAHAQAATGRSTADVRRRQGPAARRPARHRARTAPACRPPLRSRAPREGRPRLAGQRDLRPDAAGRRGCPRSGSRSVSRSSSWRTPRSPSGSSGAVGCGRPRSGVSP